MSGDVFCVPVFSAFALTLLARHFKSSSMKTLLCLLFVFAGFANAQNPAPPAPPKAPWKPLGTGLDKPKTGAEPAKPGTGTGLLDGGAYGKTVTVDTLRVAYAKNEIAADQKFKGQQCTISGAIEEIAADGTVTLSTPVSDFKVLGVRCQFADASTLAKLKSGQKLRLLGTVEGMKGGSLMISNCSLFQ